MSQRMINVGEPSPWFVCRSPSNPKFHFDSVAGRYVVLCFFGSAADPGSRRVLDDVLACRQIFDDDKACFFGVSIDPDDETQGRVHNSLPGVRFFWDFDRAVSRLYGAVTDGGAGGTIRYQQLSLVLDERLRVLVILPFGDHADVHVPELMTILSELPAMAPEKLAEPPAPVLLVPRIFEPDLCQKLIDYYESLGGDDSGFMRDVEGMTALHVDHGYKQRRDQEIVDESLRTATMHCIHDRLVPELRKAFQFHATRIERYIVACYDSATGGHFRAHRDDRAKGTAHRRFAVSLNLNADFEGGNLRFPEFGRQMYRAPVGGAVVFSCSLLHEATAITQGKRYAFLPFLYDEAAAKIRQENLKYVDDQKQRHRITGQYGE